MISVKKVEDFLRERNLKRREEFEEKVDMQAKLLPPGRAVGTILPDDYSEAQANEMANAYRQGGWESSVVKRNNELYFEVRRPK